jgi:lysophospholipase L1-like esterase
LLQSRLRTPAVAAVSALAAAGLAISLPAAAEQAGHPAPPHHDRPPAAGGWVGSWGAAPSAGTDQLGTGAVTVRNVVHTGLGGAPVRIRLTNAYGTRPTTFTGVTVALAGSAGSAAAAPGTMRTVTFGGAPTVTVPAGAEAVSDPVALDSPADRDLLVSVGVPADSGPATFHLHATQTSYVAAGDGHTADPAATAFTSTTTSWFYIDELDVRDPAARGTVVAYGDSITDGVTSTPGADRRWPDDLARRLSARPAAHRCGVLDEGISGNRILLDGAARSAGTAAAGASAVARLQRDVLSRTAPRTLVVFEGINDLIWPPHQLDPEQIIGGLRQIIRQAHADGITVVGATISPATGYTGEGFGADQEATRLAVNAWIRHGAEFDAVADFDAVLCDPADPHRLAAAYDSGDHLHPNDAGYQALADSLDLGELC